MLNLWTRRSFCVGTAVTTLSPLAAIAQNDPAISFGGQSIDSMSDDVADCGIFADEIARIDAEIAALAIAPDTEIESRYAALSSALDSQTGQLAKAIAATDTAIAATAAEIEGEVISALSTSNDLLLATAVQTRNPQLVGAAVGAHVLTGTGIFAYQTINARDGQQVQKAAVALFEGRKTMVTVFIDGPGSELAKKQAEMVVGLAVSAARITAGAWELSELQGDMTQLKSRLAALDKDTAGLPVNVSDSRTFFILRLQAEKELYQLIQTEAPDDCQIDNATIVLQ